MKGGEIVAEGAPEDVLKVERSFTGKYLAPLLRGDHTKTDENARAQRAIA